MEYYEFHYLVKELIEHMKRESENSQGQKDQTDGMMSNMKMPSMKVCVRGTCQPCCRQI